MNGRYVDVFQGSLTLHLSFNRRMAYPNRWCELVQEFGRSYGELSAIFTRMISDINYRFTHLLQDVDNLPWFRGELQGFCDAIYDKGAPLRNCWGFIDGTARKY